LQIATPSEKIQDTLDSAFAQSKTVRAYLDYAGSLRAELGLQDDQEMFKIMTTALDETEKALGGALETSNAQGMTKYAQAVQKACDAAGIKPVDMAKLGAEVDFEAIEGELAELKAVEDEVGKEQA
jgi:HPt (histidine-containing phosphotransfer) domain-containing protein